MELRHQVKKLSKSGGAEKQTFIPLASRVYVSYLLLAMINQM